MRHLIEPHRPGTLHECPGCEGECNCTTLKALYGKPAQCIRCARRDEDKKAHQGK